MLYLLNGWLNEESLEKGPPQKWEFWIQIPF